MIPFSSITCGGTPTNLNWFHSDMVGLGMYRSSIDKEKWETHETDLFLAARSGNSVRWA
jgi:hypothetical protein